ncbi:hypothetical protein AU468_13685 [Alkalispirochaeta sphaeroplastigenens]|uniref:histidine kinase n=2 Tax=Alkalispirochaeta sphaeroplastigenens TaxID=1187066 RepID=A0A2S4JFT3_9SPIO|nr:hypothetical protein AU468_13685 [Alkalispirochaeta sphaeroplastigenens]
MRLALGVFIGAVIAVGLFVTVDLVLSHRRAVTQAEELALIQVQLVEQTLTNHLAEVRRGLAGAAREADLLAGAGSGIDDEVAAGRLLAEYFLFLEAVANAGFYDSRGDLLAVLRRSEPQMPRECYLCPAFGNSHHFPGTDTPGEGLLWFAHRSHEGSRLKAVVEESYLTRTLQMILGSTMGGVLFSREGDVVARWGDPRGHAAALRADQSQGIDQALFSGRREGSLVAVTRARSLPLDVAVVLPPEFFLGQWRSRVIVLLLVSAISLAVLGWFLRAVHRRAAQIWEARGARALARERELQLRETHHRVKNHLAVIDSIISLQVTRSSDSAIRQLLQDLRGRVAAISLIHSSLYQAEDLGRVVFPDYCNALVRSIRQACGAPGEAADIRLEVEDIPLPLETVKPLGLIIQELVMNAFKYAGDSPGLVVHLRFGRDGSASGAPSEPADPPEPADSPEPIDPAHRITREKGKNQEDQAGQPRLHLVISDNGPGFPDDFDPSGGASLGMLLVEALVDDLEGEMIRWNHEGAHIKIVFSLP